MVKLIPFYYLTLSHNPIYLCFFKLLSFAMSYSELISEAEQT